MPKEYILWPQSTYIKVYSSWGHGPLGNLQSIDPRFEPRVELSMLPRLDLQYSDENLHTPFVYPSKLLKIPKQKTHSTNPTTIPITHRKPQ